MATLRSVGSLRSFGSLRSIGSMHTISEGYATLVTPVSESAGGSTSLDEAEADVAVLVDEETLSDGAVSESSARLASEKAARRYQMNHYLLVAMSVIIGAYVGVGIRVLLIEFAHVMYDSQTALLQLLGVEYFLPNVCGCFIMGFVTRLKPVLRGQYDILLTGVITGFCGSCTTFASWDLGAALLFVDGRWLDAILMLSVHVASAISSLRFGVHVAEGVVHYLTLQEYPFQKPPVDLLQLNLGLERHMNHFRGINMHTFGPLVTRRVQATSESLAVARDSCNELMAEITQVEAEKHPIEHHGLIWIATVLSLTSSCWALAFCGFDNYTSSRLVANRKPMYTRFPLFTFLPNVVASCLSCMMAIIGSIVLQDSDAAYRAFIMWGQGGVMVGFLGSLSTVSTWVYELDDLSSKRFYWAYRYGVVSVVVSQLASMQLLKLLGWFYVFTSNSDRMMASVSS
ncbi:hypothetical protein CCR75_001996 [Bremia lactucae]|uniref:Fluoride ion transporter CrcB n=1 Tax=Bremia lactucae TaxID=4779 RepID=A0A976P029_BRELC|nr:hypothetical protein CCR75_001996 [Bremia lactucae]